MKKQFLAVLLIFGLVLSLSGCNTVPPISDTTATAGDFPTTTVAAGDYTYPPIPFDSSSLVTSEELNISIQYLPEEIENPKDLPVLKWVCVMSGEQTWTETAVHELNQMLSDRNLPFRIQFVMVTAQQTNIEVDCFSIPLVQEVLADADLIYARTTPDERQEYLFPITEYATGGAEPSLEKAVAHELNWLTGSAGGEIYGIPTYPVKIQCGGWQIDSSILAEYGLTAADFDRNFWEMDSVFAKIYEKNGNNPFLHIDISRIYSSTEAGAGFHSVLPGSIAQETSYAYQQIGAYFGIDHSQDAPVVVNILETDIVRNTQEAIIRYRNAGYVGQFQGMAPVRFASVPGNKAHTDANGILFVPVTPVTFNSGYARHTVSGVAAESLHKEEALHLLSLIAEDEAFQTQLLFGKEGRDYAVSNGEYEILRQQDGSYYSMDFLSMHSYFSSVTENQNAGLFKYEGKTKLETYLDNMNSVRRVYYPIIFELSHFSEELEAAGKILGSYYRFFPWHKDVGVVGVKGYRLEMNKARYDEMLQKLKAAGSDDVLIGLQEQLDTWLKEHPDW